jgi:hypothetical protein
MAKSHLQLVTPTEILRTVPPKRAKNADLRTREHLTVDEVEALIEAAKGNRYGHRDATTILLAVRHGLRVSTYESANISVNGRVCSLQLFQMVDTVRCVGVAL